MKARWGRSCRPVEVVADVVYTVEGQPGSVQKEELSNDVVPHRHRPGGRRSQRCAFASAKVTSSTDRSWAWAWGWALF